MSFSQFLRAHDGSACDLHFGGGWEGVKGTSMAHEGDLLNAFERVADLQLVLSHCRIRSPPSISTLSAPITGDEKPKGERAPSEGRPQRRSACMSRSSARDEQFERLHVELDELLLSHGADANLESDTTGFSPLLRDRYERTERVLLAYGADVRETSKFGVTPLHMAAAFEVSPGLWKDLLKHGADPSATNDNSKTPLELVPNGVMRTRVELPITV
ncbi:hypothetical protein BBJ28_00018570, partial [Nothophytophthora sp. Chile5]